MKFVITLNKWTNLWRYCGSRYPAVSVFSVKELLNHSSNNSIFIQAQNLVINARLSFGTASLIQCFFGCWLRFHRSVIIWHYERRPHEILQRFWCKMCFRHILWVPWMFTCICIPRYERFKQWCQKAGQILTWDLSLFYRTNINDRNNSYC